jgi:hypothetical protein
MTTYGRGKDEAGPDLPTAREAMLYAVQSGRSGDIELARFWLDVAKELRQAGVEGRWENREEMRLFPERWAESAERFYRNQEQQSVTANMELRTEAARAFEHPEPEPVAHPRTLDERTQVFQRPEPASAECKNCHTPIYRDAAADGDPRGIWRHRYTQQYVCAEPMLAAGDGGMSAAHTFAEPLVEN